jgi:cytochrome P450
LLKGIYLHLLYLVNKSMQSETNKISLHVMAGAGYGYPMEWDEVGEIPEGHEMSFNDSIHGTLNNIITYVIVPKFLLGLPIKHFRETKRAFDEIGKYVLDLLEMGKKGEGAKPETGENILSNLIRHSIHIWDGPKDHALKDDEIIGNAFVFLVGGHETTYIPLRTV